MGLVSGQGVPTLPLSNRRTPLAWWRQPPRRSTCNSPMTGRARNFTHLVHLSRTSPHTTLTPCGPFRTLPASNSFRPTRCGLCKLLLFFQLCGTVERAWRNPDEFKWYHRILRKCILSGSSARAPRFVLVIPHFEIPFTPVTPLLRSPPLTCYYVPFVPLPAVLGD